MPWIMQMVWFALLFIGIGLALWISFWVLLVLFGLGVVMILWTHLRDFLLAKGILNPTPGVPPDGIIIEHEADRVTTLIEGDFERVEDEKTKQD